MSDPLIDAPTELRNWQDWPLLILGPIVRKVTRNKAHIFVATKDGCTAQILIHKGRADFTDVPDRTDTLGVNLRKIGAHLYVGLLEIDLPDPQPNQVYSYDLQLHLTGPTPGGAMRLNDLGLLGNPPTGGFELEGHVPLGYQQNQLPSFLTPPSAISDLRIAQASCRKPHGNPDCGYEPDALPILDELIKRSLGLRQPDAADSTHIWLDARGTQVSAPTYPPTEFSVRPHQLCMTGDQIYADDVAPAMLDAISHAAHQLMGWDEELPGIVEGLNGFLVQPGWRSRYLHLAGIKEPPLEGDPNYDQSHLLRFGEWCAMYLMAWSPALWPRTSDNSKIRLREPGDLLPVSKVIGALNIYENLPTTKAREQATLPITFLMDKAKSLAIDGIEAATETELERSALWMKYRDPAIQYGSTTPYVRRILANTPTYMMFDDHEITDDWYTTRNVAERLLGLETPPKDFWGDEVGPRILRNGLSAYAIFQHWGNVPDDFAGWESAASPPDPSVGVQLLDLWKPVNVPGEVGQRPILSGRVPAEFQSQTGPHWWQDETGSVPSEASNGWLNMDWARAVDVRLADVLLRIDGLPTDQDGRYPGTGDPADRDTFNRFRWDYALEFDSHHLVALDTRTWRRFPSEVGSNAPSGTSSPSDVFLARSATAGILEVYAEAWINTNDPGCRLYGALLQAIADLLNETSLTDFASKLVAVCDALQFYVDLVMANTLSLNDVTYEINRVREEIDGTALFSTRPVLSDEASYWVQAAAILQHVASIEPVNFVELNNTTAQATLPGIGAYLDAVALGSSKSAMVKLRAAINDSGNVVATNLPDLSPDLSDLVAIEAARAFAVGVLSTEIAAIEVHDRSNFFFRDGTGYLAAELISAPAMEWMVTAPLIQADQYKETVILSPAPLFADTVVDTIQRTMVASATLTNQAGAEAWEYESWTANPTGFNNFLVAAKTLKNAVVLSGDVHYAYSSRNYATIEHEDVATTYIQLTASSAKNSDATTKKIGTYGYLIWDQSSSFNIHQFNPVALFNTGWTYLNTGQVSDETADTLFTAQRFVGWFKEMLEGRLEDAISEYHLDDALLMMQEFSAIRGPADLLKWRFRWFFEPGLRVIGDVVAHPDLYAQAAWDYVTEAPINTFNAWMHEALWMMMSVLNDFAELADDPKKKVFGHSLYSRDVLIQMVGEIYQALGVDPAYGFKIEKSSLHDLQGPERLMKYGARNRFAYSKPNTMMYGNEQESHIVGSANVGLVRFDRTLHHYRVQHDILFYPVPSHPGVVTPQPGPPYSNKIPQPDIGEVTGFGEPRSDWMSTQHHATIWTRSGPTPTELKRPKKEVG